LGQNCCEPPFLIACGKAHGYAEWVSRVFLSAEWRNLVMLNFEVDPELLRRFAPSGTEVEVRAGSTYISLVGFQFSKTKVFGLPIPFHRNFEEVNLRFYVQRKIGEEIRRGVVFIREVVPRWMVAKAARTFYNENYVSRAMSHCVEIEDGSRKVHYSWKSVCGWNRIQVKTQGDPELPVPGSHAHSIVEHQWGYCAQRDGGCMEYQVKHPSWRIWPVNEACFEGNVDDLYGHELAATIRKPPTSAFLAEGSPIIVYTGMRL
jgi:uncharacterized protein YqjF (DUF2071 family)